MKRIRQCVAIFVIAILCLNSSTHAAIVLTVQDTTIVADQLGFVDVFIRSDNSDRLTLFSYDFNITGTPGTALELTAQDLSDDTLGNYVLAGENFGINVVTQTNSQLVADDAQDSSGLGYRLLPGTDLLLARLDLRHIVGPGFTTASSVGHEFEITLDLSSGETLFQNDSEGTIPVDLMNSKLVGTITVSASAVPEPGSLTLLTAICGWIGMRKRRRRKVMAS